MKKVHILKISNHKSTIFSHLVNYNKTHALRSLVFICKRCLVDKYSHLISYCIELLSISIALFLAFFYVLCVIIFGLICKCYASGALRCSSDFFNIMKGLFWAGMMGWVVRNETLWNTSYWFRKIISRATYMDHARITWLSSWNP